MKLCKKCNKQIAKSNFYKDAAKVDGLRPYCKTCDSSKKKQWRLINIDKDIANKKEYRTANKKAYLTYLSNWRKNNSAKCVIYTNARRAAKLQATPKWADQQKIEDKYKFAAFMTWLTMGIKYHVDHIEPLVNDEVCGLHTHDNLQILRADHNLQKSNKRPTIGSL